VDPVLGPEMRSTGEVMGVARTFGEAFAKAQTAAGLHLPTEGTVFFSVNTHDKESVAPLARRFVDMGFKLVATHGTADVLEEAGMQVERVFAVKEGRPNVVDFIKSDRIQLIVNTPSGQMSVFDEAAIRRAAVSARVATITTLAATRAAADGIEALQKGEYHVEGSRAEAIRCGKTLRGLEERLGAHQRLSLRSLAFISAESCIHLGVPAAACARLLLFCCPKRE